MPGDNKRLRNTVLLVVAVACLVYAGFAIRSFWRRPRGSNLDEVLLVCVKCSAESTVSSAEFNALPMDQGNLAVECPECKELGAYIASMRCPECARGIPNTPGLFGTAYECPYCKAPLGTAPRPPG
jgi:hypothetical protein